VSSGISSNDAAPVPGALRTTTNESNAAVAMTFAAPPCLRQERTSMTLVGLLLRGMDGDDGPQTVRPTVPTFDGTGWAYHVPEFPRMHTAGAGRLRPNRYMQQVLGEALQVIASDIPAEGGASSSRGVYTSQ
jgi:hypothetical protein